MNCHAQIASAAVAVAFIASISAALAEEWISFDPRQWQATLDFDGSRRRGDAGTTTDLNLEERIRVRQEGYALDRRIATFAADLELAFEQGKFKGPDRNDTSEGTLTNYDVSTSILHGTPFPVSFSGQAARNEGTLDGGFGSRTEFVNQTRNAAFYYRNPYFPSRFRYSEKLDDSTFQSASGLPSERDSSLRTLSLSGRSRKLDLSLEQEWFDDHASTIDRDYEESRLRASHGFRWGRGSNLDSRLNYWNRSGHSPREKLNIDESAKLRHSSKLSTSYRYRFGYVKQDTETQSHAASAGAAHQLYKTLRTNLTFSGSHDDSDETTEKEYDGKLRFNYRKAKLIRGGGDLTAALGIGYGVTDRDSSGGQLEAIDESQTVPANSVVLLNERFIDTATIVITNLAGLITYTEGPDYTVISTGEDRTELHIIGGGQISIGQTILIDYKYQSLPTQRFSRLPYDFSVSVDFGWINVYQRIFGEEQSLISGQDATALNERRNITTGMELRWQRPATRATFGAESRFSRSAGFSSESVRFRQSLRHQTASLGTLTASMAEDFQESDGRTVELYTANVNLNWRPSRGLTVKPYMNAWMRNSEPAPDDTSQAIEDFFVRAGADLRWRVRQIDLAVRYYHDRRTGTQTNSVEDRLMFTLKRRL